MRQNWTVIVAVVLAIIMLTAAIALRPMRLVKEIEPLETSEIKTLPLTTETLTETTKTEPTLNESTTEIKVYTETTKRVTTTSETTEKKKESKVVSKLAEIESKLQNKTRKVETTAAPKITPADFRRAGVIYYNGYKFTYYSEKVLPGKGLRIPGRHSDGNFVRDGDGYIVLASQDLPKGTVVQTLFGPGKVYDYCGVSGTIDVYVSW